MAAIEHARRLWRTLLPQRLRYAIGPAIGAVRAPLVRALSQNRLPPADPIDRRATDSVALAGLLSTPHGLGAAARLCVAELRAAGCSVVPLDLAPSFGAPREEGIAPAEGAPAASFDAVILHVNPSDLDAAANALDRGVLKRRRLIGYWVWELEQVPADWARAARRLHEIWSPSRFAADAIARVVDRPVSIAPHPCALAPAFDRSDATRTAARAALGLSSSTFVAVTSFSMSSVMARKNPIAAVRAFADAFPPGADARLLVRCRDGAVFPEGVATLRSEIARAADRVTFLDADAQAYPIGRLYAAADVYLSLHRSEGFGLNLAEAMLSGLPVAATAWSGNLDFMSEDSSILVPARLVPVEDPQRVYRDPRAQWADPDHDFTVDALRRLAAEQGWRESLARRGLDYARAHLSGGAAARLLRAPEPAR